MKAAAAKMDAEAQAAAAGKAVKESEASSGAMSLEEQASRVDALEQRFETALDASKATTAEVLSTVSSTFEGKLTSLEAKLSGLEDVIKTAASSSELEVMAKGLSDSMSTSVAGLQSKGPVGDLEQLVFAWSYRRSLTAPCPCRNSSEASAPEHSPPHAPFPTRKPLNCGNWPLSNTF